MVLLRLTAYLFVAIVGAALLLYLLTSRRTYLTLAWRVFRVGLVLAAILGAFLFLERI